MKLLLDAFWRAGMYCLMPRVIAMSVLPLIIVMGGTVTVMYFFSAPIISATDAWLKSYVAYDVVMQWLNSVHMGFIQNLLAHIVLLMLVTPVLVLITLLLVNLMATPMAASLVAERRFPSLTRRTGLTFPGSLLWSLWSFFLALVVLILTTPLWLIPPFILSFFLPPLIWGWFAYRVSSYDVLVNYCTRAVTKTIIAEHRSWLLLIGVASAFLGAVPSFGSLILLGVFTPPQFFLFVMPISIWLYTLVFMFSALWFAHYCVAVVAQQQRTALVDKEALAAPHAGPALLTPSSNSTNSPHNSIGSTDARDSTATQVVDADSKSPPNPAAIL